MHRDMGRCVTAGPQPAWADQHQPRERGRQEGDGRGVVAGQPCCLSYLMCGGHRERGGAIRRESITSFWEVIGLGLSSGITVNARLTLFPVEKPWIHRHPAGVRNRWLKLTVIVLTASSPNSPCTPGSDWSPCYYSGLPLLAAPNMFMVLWTPTSSASCRCSPCCGRAA